MKKLENVEYVIRGPLTEVIRCDVNAARSFSSFIKFGCLGFPFFFFKEKRLFQVSLKNKLYVTGNTVRIVSGSQSEVTVSVEIAALQEV